MDKVLVVQVYTHHKQYCRWMYPKFYNSLTYKNKSIAFIDEQKYPELMRKQTGEERAALGRQYGIEAARKGDFDWVFFLDLIEPHVLPFAVVAFHKLIYFYHIQTEFIGDDLRCFI